MNKLKSIMAVSVALMLAASAANAREFGGYDCTDDCSGHKAGFDWAERKNLRNSNQCGEILRTSPNRTSFYEGCRAYLDDPSRGSDEDDDGDTID